jgi:hypothetical protein
MGLSGEHFPSTRSRSVYPSRILVGASASFLSSSAITHRCFARQAYTERSLPSRLKWAEDRLNWFKTIDPKVLKEINRRKKAQGKYMIRGPKRVPRRAPGPFFLYGFISLLALFFISSPISASSRTSRKQTR